MPPSFQRTLKSGVEPALVLVFFSAVYGLFFLPVLAKGLLLASGDAYREYLPSYLAAKTPWTPYLFAGYPLMADPENMSWYLPAIVVAPLGLGAWNVFVISAYVIASSTMYALAKALTGSRIGALIAGVVYGMSGFYMAHLDHTTFIHGFAWLPLIMFALLRLQTDLNARWIVLTAIAVCLCMTGGHPQVWVYALTFAAMFALVTGPTRERGYLWGSALGLGLGVGLAAVQIVPTIELFRLSTRAAIDFRFFNAIHLPPRQLATLLFPALFGAGEGWTGPSLYPEYFGADNVSELAGYVGILPLMLGLVALRNRTSLNVRFWTVSAIVALLLALGKPMSWLVFHLPVYGSLRAPARQLLIFTFCAAVLAGFGTAEVEAQPSERRLRLVAISMSILAALFAVVLLAVFSAPSWRFARAWSVPAGFADSWRNPSITIPVIALGIGAVALGVWAKWPRRWSGAVMVAVVIVDLATFGWFCSWRALSIDAGALAMPHQLEGYRSAAALDGSRVWRVSTAMLPQPNLPLPWQLRVAGGYSSLEISRYWWVKESFQEPASAALDLMGVRYAIVSGPEYIPDDAVNKYSGWYYRSSGTIWSRASLNGSGIRLNADARDVSLVAPNVLASAISVASIMSSSVDVPQGWPCLEVTVDGHEGSERLVLRAGIETAEWAWNRPDVRHSVRHRQANRLTSTQVRDIRFGAFEGLGYYATIPFSRPLTITRIHLRWIGQPLPAAPDAMVQVSKLTLIDHARHRQFPVEGPLLALGDASHWQVHDQLPGKVLVLEDAATTARRSDDAQTTAIYENRHPLSHAWLVTDIREMADAETLRSVASGRLPDGSPFLPFKTGLIEASSPVPPGQLRPAPSALRVLADGASFEAETESRSVSLLVLSEIHYPGWEATIDGVPATVVVTDHVLRGVLVPPGAHRVTMTYRPIALEVGATMTAASALGLILVALVF